MLWLALVDDGSGGTRGVAGRGLWLVASGRWLVERAVRGWVGSGVNQGRGWRGLAVMSMLAMRAVHALLAVRAMLAVMASLGCLGEWGRWVRRERCLTLGSG